MYLTRRAVLSAGAASSVALLAACGAGSTAAKDDARLAQASGPITLVPFLSGITPEMMSGWDELVLATYRQRRPTVKIELVPQTGPTIDRIEKLRALTAAGQPPAIQQEWARRIVQARQTQDELDVRAAQLRVSRLEVGQHELAAVVKRPRQLHAELGPPALVLQPQRGIGTELGRP